MEVLYSEMCQNLYLILARSFNDPLTDEVIGRLIMSIDMDGYERAAITHTFSDRYHHEMSILFMSTSDARQVDEIYYRDYELNITLTERDRLMKTDTRVMFKVNVLACSEDGITIKERKQIVFTNLFPPDVYHRFIFSAHTCLQTHVDYLVKKTDEILEKGGKKNDNVVVSLFNR
jgi:hypothetical protein